LILNTKPNKKKRYVIYTRCSTDDQAQGDFTTLDAQAHHCKNMIDAFGYEMANFGKNGIINDEGYSGKDLNRPGIQSILKDIQDKKSFDGVIFFRLDRLTRNPRDLYALIDLFRDKEIDFISVRENLDSSTAIGRVVIGILGLLSAFERELTGERVKASCVARFRQGKWIGGMLPFGYKLINEGPPLPNGRQPHKIIIDETVAPKLKMIWEMAADNKPLSEIGGALTRTELNAPQGKIWRKQSISAILKNPFYKGIMRYNGEIHRGNHEAIVDDGLWDLANKMSLGKIPGHRFVKTLREYTYLLNGLVRCGKCGSHYITYFAYGRGRKRFYYYTCSRMMQKMGCNAEKLPAIGFDAALIDFFKRASKDQDIIVKAIGDAILDSREKLDKVEKEIKPIEKKLKIAREAAEKLLSLAMENTVSKGPIYKAKMDALDIEMFMLQDKLSKLEAQRKVAQLSANSGEFLYTNIKFAMKYLDQAPPDAQKALLHALVKSVTIFDGYVELRMYVGQPFEEIIASLPAIPKNNTGNALNDKKTTPQEETCEVVGQNDARGSNERPNWLRLAGA
jgi:site-specific DNA recombinase